VLLRHLRDCLSGLEFATCCRSIGRKKCWTEAPVGPLENVRRVGGGSVSLGLYMPQQNPKRPIASTLAFLAGIAIVFGSLLLSLQFPNLHIGIAIAIGAVLGTPFIVLGLRLYEGALSAAGTSKKFWPSRTEGGRMLWGFVALVTLLASILGPIALFIGIGYFLPSGDDWGIVTIRLLFLALAVLGYYWWFKFASKTIPNRFRGRLSDEALDDFIHGEPKERSTTPVAAATRNWQLLLITLVAFCVALGVINFDSPLFKIDVGPRRTRGFVRLIQWIRGNPNTVSSSATIVGAAAFALYVFKIRRAAVNADATPGSRHVTKP
jgi:hypothetical protein